MISLSVVFITRIPNMLKAGNKIGTIKNAFSDMVKLRLHNRFFSQKFILIKLFSKVLVLYPIAANIMNAILKEIKRGSVDNGVS
jgi:hypothetical protein